MSRFGGRIVAFVAATFTILLLLSLAAQKLAEAQMISSGAKDRPGLPLPPGMKPPLT